MLNKINELVYGKNEYEKCKIEERFNILKGQIDKVSIDNLEDFEELEKIIFKIREQLRVKSSNLNKTIRESSKLSKREVNDIIDRLCDIRMNFLNRAFSVIGDDKPKEVEKVIENRPSEIDNEIKNTIESNDSSDFYENSHIKVIFNNGKVPFLQIHFKDSFDLSIIRNVSSIFFEIVKCHGTNIVYDKDRVLIIARYMDDNFFDLPVKEVDLEEIYNKIIGNMDKPQEVEDSREENYVKIDTPSDNIVEKSVKEEGDSLDSLISGLEDRDFKPDPKPEEDSSNVSYERVEEVVKEEKEIVNPEIVVLEDVIYNDDRIKVYLHDKSKVLGELIIEPIKDETINEIDEATLSYMNLFAKIFASLLFENVSAHGTNIIYDYLDNKIRVVPRYQEDKLKLSWDPKTNNDEFYDQIREKLLGAMNSVSDNASKDGGLEKVEDKSSSTSKEDKLRRIMNCVKRLP